MKNIFKILLLFNINLIVAQTPQNPINMLRANDNFSFVKTDSLKKGFNRLKHIQLTKKTNISFGGDLRENYQYFENQNFGDVPPTFSKISVGQLWHRMMAHTNIELGSKVRVFAQLSSTFRFMNPNPIAPEIDENRLSLHQAFIDYSFCKKWLIRVGRQEIAYGNNRVLTFREGPNTRLTFDAALLKYSTKKRKIDLLALSPVVSKRYEFDDKSLEEFVIGAYATEYFLPEKFMLDYYILNFTSEKRKYNFVSGSENRLNFGLRLFSKNPKFNYELESTYQTGTFNNLKINAFSISTDVNYKIEPKYKLTIGVAGNYISGDKNRTDNELNTYNLIFSKPYFGLAAPIGSSNLENINPYIKVNPSAKTSILASVYFMNRQSNQDGTYSPGMGQVRPTPNKLFASSARNLGVQYALETNYQYNNNISFAIDAAYFEAGNYVKQTGKGLDITYYSFKATFKF